MKQWFSFSLKACLFATSLSVAVHLPAPEAVATAAPAATATSAPAATSESQSAPAAASAATVTSGGPLLTTLTGVPGNGYADGLASSARFSSPLGIDVRDKTVMIADTDNNMIRSYHGGKVASMAGRIRGRNVYGQAMGGYVDHTLGLAVFNKPSDCLFLADGRIVAADRENHAVRMVEKSWVITWNGTGEAGYQEGMPGKAMFSSPCGLAADQAGNIYVADTGNHCIRTIDAKGKTSLVAGVPQQGGYRDGDTGEALFMEPSSVAVAEDGSLYVADTGNQRIRRIADGQVTTLAGGSHGAYLDTEYKSPGLRDGQGQEALFAFPQGICMAGPVIIVSDTGNHVIRAVSPDGRTEIIAGTGEPGYKDGPVREAVMNMPSDVAWEDGLLYIMDSGNSALRSMEFDPEQWLIEQEAAR